MALDLTNETSGRLVALYKTEKRGGFWYWMCRCDCGVEKAIRGSLIARKRQQSCGCLASELLSKRQTVHGLGRTPQAAVWRAMINRCHNPKTRAFKWYGAKGVKVCDRWRESYPAFLADMGPQPTGHQIDRFPDQKGDYEPGNCRWATASENCRNKANNRILTVDGVSRPMTEWSEVTGVKVGTIWQRLKLGWTDEDCIKKPIRKNQTNEEF